MRLNSVCGSFIWVSVNISSNGIKVKRNGREVIKLGLNFSFEAILLMYINRINNPPMNMRKVIIAIHDDTRFFEITIVDSVV